MNYIITIILSAKRQIPLFTGFFATVLLSVASLSLFGQQMEFCQKIGFADIDMIAQRMPEMRLMEAELASLGGQFQNQLKTKYAEYHEKLAAYESADPAASSRPVVSREELVRLQSEIQKFAMDAELSYKKKQSELMQPILLRISKTIDEVAREHRYSIILHRDNPSGNAMVLFGMREYDISELVLIKMGLAVSPRKQE